MTEKDWEDNTMRNIQDKQQRKERDRELVYQLDGRPGLSTAVPLGLQHVLAMFTSNLAPILIIAGVCGLSGADMVIMVQCAMFVSGLTTFIQLYPLKLGKNFQVGAKLPICYGNFIYLCSYSICHRSSKRDRGRAGRMYGRKSGGSFYGLFL